ncbi:MAG: TonB-dependent receptor [Sphingomonas bacterium]|nr:TonB-dependent receptor [Sphingomonas bacterium]
MGDTRDKEQRRRETLQTVKNAIELGARRQVQLAHGGTMIEPLTLANHTEKLAVADDDDRDDAERASFVIKTPPTEGSATAAFQRLAAFAKAVPVVGRAVVEADATPGVSIVDPSRYRKDIVAAIAADATASAAAFGPTYAAEVEPDGGVAVHGLRAEGRAPRLMLGLERYLRALRAA